MTWKLFEPSMIRYFFNFASAPESARSSISRQMIRTLILLQIFWISWKCWADLYCEEQLSLFNDATFSGMFFTVWSISSKTCFIVVRHLGVVTLFSVKFYYARMHSDGFMAPMQWLWLEFYWKFKVFTEISVNE